MKKYLADILTLARFILATILLIMAIFDTNADIGAGLLIFAFAELTDAFDGTLSRKYPFPKGKAPKYRKYAVKYDMWADAFTAFAVALFFTLRVNVVAGLSIAGALAIVALVVELIVYGRIFGHPDDCTPHSLTKRNFPLAKKIVMARRKLYLVYIATIVIWMLYASAWSLATKIILTVLAVAVAIFLWFFLAERRQHISRDAVALEQKLTQNSSRKSSC